MPHNHMLRKILILFQITSNTKDVHIDILHKIAQLILKNSSPQVSNQLSWKHHKINEKKFIINRVFIF